MLKGQFPVPPQCGSLTCRATSGTSNTRFVRPSSPPQYASNMVVVVGLHQFWTPSGHNAWERIGTETAAAGPENWAIPLTLV